MLKCRINWCFVWHASPSEQNKMSQVLRSFSKLFSINICDNITCHLIQLKYLSFLNSRQILDIGSQTKNHCYIYAVSLSVATQYIEFKKLKRMFILSMYAKTER